jgi:O-antigen ligase
MDLSKKTVQKIDIRDSRLTIGVLIIISEIFLGFLCLILGLKVIPFVLGSTLMLCVFFYPKIGLIIMLFLMPGVEYLKYDIGTASITPFRVLLIPTLLGTVLHIVVHRSPIKMLSMGPPIVALISVAVMSIIQSSYIGPGLIRLIFFLSLFSTAFVVAQLLDDKKSIQRAVHIMIASSVVLITLALIEAYFGFKGLPPTITGGHRLFGKQIGALYIGPHLFNVDITTYLPFVLILASTAKRLNFIFYMLLTLAFIAGMLLSGALAGWLAALVSLTLLIIIGFAQKQYKSVIKVFKWLILIILLASIMVTLIIPPRLLEARFRRLISLVSVEGVYTSRTAEVRIPVWIAAKNMFYDHPILGVGLGAFGYEYYKYLVARVGFVEKEFAHRGSFNVFMDRIAEMGILGIIAFLWFLIAYARLLLKNLALIEDPFLANMLLASSVASLAIFLQMQFESGHFWGNNFWVLAGLSLAIINVAKTKGLLIYPEGKTIDDTNKY